MRKDIPRATVYRAAHLLRLNLLLHLNTRVRLLSHLSRQRVDKPPNERNQKEIGVFHNDFMTRDTLDG